jgi:hypothetical protein
MLYYVTLCYVFFCYVVYACEFRIEHPDFCDAFIVASRFSTLPTGRPGVGKKHVSRGSAVETGTTLSLFDIQFFPVICNCLYFVHIELYRSKMLYACLHFESLSLILALLVLSPLSGLLSVNLVSIAIFVLGDHHSVHGWVASNLVTGSWGSNKNPALVWLVLWNMNFLFLYIGKNHPN